MNFSLKRVSFKRTFKKHFPFFGIVYYATITLPLHTPLPKEIHSLICWCISPIKMIFRINCFSSLIIIKHKTKVLIYISTLENHRKGWSREIPEPVFSIYLTILFPLLSKQKPKTYLYRLLLLPCC